ncbi:hypothetical protein H6763_02105 [Candidatus Nomurabacteria bacterium]|uniref:Uncharacterized protein n=1 Tax=Candidatus Dojkabacteria bacterium TaxID=2099670 RepID=A0A955I0D9_9BACT|nr:hypothetical protein [Candidatus Dojkabacteria bacterium]MCB9789777.1 hypothetical protein [Candidatus Nomurabacteria bacterium]MCB9803600.1 hypothetical protein [Candidatus Nomurabacteria bacterium]
MQQSCKKLEKTGNGTKLLSVQPSPLSPDILILLVESVVFNLLDVSLRKSFSKKSNKYPNDYWKPSDTYRLRENSRNHFYVTDVYFANTSILEGNLPTKR